MTQVILYAAATALALLGPLIFMLKSETYLADKERAPTAETRRRRRLDVASLSGRRLGLMDDLEDYLDPKTKESKGDDHALMKSVVLPLGTTQVKIYRYQWSNSNDDSSSFLDTGRCGGCGVRTAKQFTNFRMSKPTLPQRSCRGLEVAGPYSRTSRTTRRSGASTRPTSRARAGCATAWARSRRR